jgi:hypothetical protein
LASGNRRMAGWQVTGGVPDRLHWMVPWAGLADVAMSHLLLRVNDDDGCTTRQGLARLL